VKWPQDLDGEIRVVELYVVNDFSQVYSLLTPNSHRSLDSAEHYTSLANKS